MLGERHLNRLCCLHDIIRMLLKVYNKNCFVSEPDILICDFDCLVVLNCIEIFMLDYRNYHVVY